MGCANAVRGILTVPLLHFILKLFYGSGGGKFQGIYSTEISILMNGQCCRGRQERKSWQSRVSTSAAVAGKGQGETLPGVRRRKAKEREKVQLSPHCVLAKLPAPSLGRHYFGTASPATCEMPSVPENLSKYENVFFFMNNAEAVMFPEGCALT